MQERLADGDCRLRREHQGDRGDEACRIGAGGQQQAQHQGQQGGQPLAAQFAERPVRFIRNERGLQQQPEREGGEQPQWQRGGADVRTKIRVGEAARKQSQCAGQQHQTQGDRARQRPDEEQREAEAEGDAVDHLASLVMTSCAARMISSAPTSRMHSRVPMRQA